MKQYLYKIILTNGTIKYQYFQRAFNIKEAVILTQAVAIQNGRGYELVSVDFAE